MGAPPVSGACSGIVKSFVEEKKYGFVEFNGKDIFLHARNCNGPHPRKGDLIFFDIEENPRKPGEWDAKNITGGTGQVHVKQQFETGQQDWGAESWGQSSYEAPQQDWSQAVQGFDVSQIVKGMGKGKGDYGPMADGAMTAMITAMAQAAVAAAVPYALKGGLGKTDKGKGKGGKGKVCCKGKK